MQDVAEELDVGALLASGRNPLAEVEARVAAMAAGDRLVLMAPFEPVPLYAQLEGWGASWKTEKLAAGFRLTVTKIAATDAGPRYLDLRHLPPPEPFVRAMAAYAELPPGACLVVHLPHRPVHLLDHFESEGITWEEYPESDGSYQVYLMKADQ